MTENTTSSLPRIGWIGTGVMGVAMAGHLIDAGYELTVYNRTASKAEPLCQKGAKLAASVREVAENSDVVFTIVGMPSDVWTVLTDENNGVIAHIKEGGIVCDMTTSSPFLASSFAEKGLERGVFVLDAPVTGGDVGARNASLSIFAGGDKQAYETILPILNCMGKSMMYCGEAGMGQKAKLANQVAIAGVMFSVCESLLFAAQAGLDVREWHSLVVKGAAGSTAMGTLGSRMMDGDDEPGFFIDHFVKDLGLVLDQCRFMKIVLPGAELADRFYRHMQQNGYGKKGTQALIKALAEFSGKEWHAIKK